MIAKIESKTQYGKMGKTGIYLLPELDEKPVVSFAHNAQDALDWAKEFPLYENAVVDDLGGGNYIVSSQWKPFQKSALFGLVEESEMEKVEYERHQLVITSQNTIHENPGFFGYKVFK